MKKNLSFVLLVVLTLFFFNSSKLKANQFQMKPLEDATYRNFDGTTNVERLVQIEYKDEVSKLRYNVLEFDNNDPDIHLVTVSDYVNFKWGMKPLEGMIYSFQQKYPHLEVLGGVNGDFYDINNTGRPTSTFIENYEVIKGTRSNRNVLIIREDGTYEIDIPQNDGYELLVLDENREVKFREKIAKFNTPAKDENEIAVVLSSYEGTISSSLNPLLIEAVDIKYSSSNFERAKGHLSLSATVDDLNNESFVIMGKNLPEIVTTNDTVIVQHRLKDFEDVRGTIGGREMLVENGEISNDVISITGFDATARAPKTSVGIKADGTIFFMTANGRDEGEDVPGLTYEENSQLMISLGAVRALRLDGGGSSTMMARNFDGTFTTLNKLSDGHMRSISNGILIVRGDIPEQPLEIKGEDTRTVFETPTNVFVDHQNNLRFSKINGATRYIITAGNKQFETSKNVFSLNSLNPGDYEIKVRVKSNLNGKTSLNSEEIFYKAKHKTTDELLNWLIKFAKNKN